MIRKHSFLMRFAFAPVLVLSLSFSTPSLVRLFSIFLAANLLTSFAVAQEEGDEFAEFDEDDFEEDSFSTGDDDDDEDDEEDEGDDEFDESDDDEDDFEEEEDENLDSDEDEFEDDEFADEDEGEDDFEDDDEFADEDDEFADEDDSDLEEDGGEDDFEDDELNAEGDDEFEDDEFAEEDEGEDEFADFDEEEGDEEGLEEGEGGEEVAEEDPLGAEETPADSGAAAEVTDNDLGEPSPEDLEAQPIDEEPVLSEEVVADPNAAPVSDEAFTDVSQVTTGPQRVNDEPNFQLENRFFEIYDQYNKNAITNEQWAEIAGGREQETYGVQQGDTLWGISEMLFGDGNFWPKVWSFNGEITNPHVIEIEDVVKFLPGDTENTPTIVVEQKRPEPEPEPVPQLASNENLAIPTPTKRYRPVLQIIPPSLPDYVDRTAGYDKYGFSFKGPKKRPPETATVTLSSFFVEEYPESSGEVVEIEGGRETAGLYDYVYVQAEGASRGSVLTVISEEGKTVGEEQVETSVGSSIDYQGEIRLEDEVGDDGLYRAVVLKVINPISVGAQTISGRIPKAKISLRGKKNGVEGEIVGGQFSEGRKVLGVGSVVYLNVGSGGGARKGDIVPVAANETLRNPDSEITTFNRFIGYVKIVKTEESVSTGIVVYSEEQISAGDVTGNFRPKNRAGGKGSSSDDDFDEDDGGFDDDSDDGFDDSDDDSGVDYEDFEGGDEDEDDGGFGDEDDEGGFEDEDDSDAFSDEDDEDADEDEGEDDFGDDEGDEFSDDEDDSSGDDDFGDDEFGEEDIAEDEAEFEDDF